jgi:hypothetical protein
MSLIFNRDKTEVMVWISDPFSSGLKKTYKEAVMQHLYNHQIKATMSTVESDYLVNIKLRFNTDEDEATFIMYISALDIAEE